MSWIAAVSICLCALVGCGGDGAPAARAALNTNADDDTSPNTATCSGTSRRHPLDSASRQPALISLNGVGTPYRR